MPPKHALILRQDATGFLDVQVCEDCLVVQTWAAVPGEAPRLTHTVTLTPLEFGVCLGLMEQVDIVDPVLRRLASAEVRTARRVS